MTGLAVNLLLFYACGGLVAVALSLDRPLRGIARIVMFLGWPWFFWIERTPRMARWLRWADRK